jgi:hypothetical protein
MSSLLHNVYSIYFDHIEDEMRQLQSARGFSRTWAAGEVKYLAMPFYSSRSSYRDNEVRDVRARDEAAAAAAVLLVEREGERTLIPAHQLREDEYFWTVDSAFFRSLEYVLREVPENASIDAIAKAIGSSRVGLPSGAILSNHSLGWLDLGFAGREVGEIVVNEEQRRADLRWVARSTPSRWRTPVSIWPRVSRRVIENLREWESSSRIRRFYSGIESPDGTNIASEPITLSGVGDWAFVETIGRTFWLPSPVQRFFAAINILENNQGIWDAYWTLYYIVRFGIENFRDGLHAEATFDGQIEPRLGMLIRDLGRLQLDEFRSAIRECSWKRFSTNLWARDYDV